MKNDEMNDKPDEEASGDLTSEELEEHQARLEKIAETPFHEDFGIEHLTSETQALASEIRDWIDDLAYGGLRDEPVGDWNSGCRLFSNEFGYPIGSSESGFKKQKAHGDLFLIFDGGMLYDIFSPNGDAYNMGWYAHDDLCNYIRTLGSKDQYDVECVTSYAISISINWS